MNKRVQKITAVILACALTLSASSYAFRLTNQQCKLAGVRVKSTPQYFVSSKYLDNPRTCLPIILLVFIEEAVEAFIAVEFLGDLIDSADAIDVIDTANIADATDVYNAQNVLNAADIFGEVAGIDTLDIDFSE